MRKGLSYLGVFLLLFAVLVSLFLFFGNSELENLNESEIKEYKVYYQKYDLSNGPVIQTKKSGEVDTLKCFELEYRMIRDRVVWYNCKMFLDDSLFGGLRTVGGLSVKYDGPKDSAKYFLLKNSVALKLDSGFSNPYPAIENRDALLLKLDSMENVVAENWNAGKLSIVNGVDPLVFSAGLISRSMYVWPGEIAVDGNLDEPTIRQLTDPYDEQYSLEKIYQKYLEIHPCFETKLIIRFDFNKDRYVHNVEILSSSIPYREFEADVKKALERRTFERGKNLEGTSHVVMKVSFFKVRGKDLFCAVPDSLEEQECRVVLVGQQDTLSYKCHRIGVVDYRGNVIGLQCAEKRKDKNQVKFNYLYQGPAENLKNFWSENGYRMEDNPNFKDLSTLTIRKAED